MLIDRSHRRWIAVTVLLAVAACAAYVPYHLHGPLTGPRGSTWQGLAYGGVATVLIFFAGLIGVRRKFRSTRGLGRAETWLKGHIWLGLLAYLLVFLHAGFRLGGALTVVLLGLFTAVVVTGIYGLVVQKLVPRIMNSQLPHETLNDQVPVYTGRLLEEARRLTIDVCGPLRPDAAIATLAVRGDKPAAPARRAGRVQEPAEGSAPLRDFFNEEVEPYLVSGRGRLGAVTSRRTVFSHVKALSGPGTHEALALVEDLCEERRRVHEQVRLHGWLHNWLIVHLPMAMVLIVLTIVHAVASLYY